VLPGFLGGGARGQHAVLPHGALTRHGLPVAPPHPIKRACGSWAGTPTCVCTYLLPTRKKESPRVEDR
jgi:hypothetical protein